MGSGKYGAISGMVSRMRMMDNISEHMAAAKTYSYKKGVVTFEAKLAESQSGLATKGVNYSGLTKESIDFTPGELEYSGTPLHVAINGDGFFQVLLEDGSMAYSRRGGFQMNAEGFLVDPDGNQVLGPDGGPISLPAPDVDISPDGSIWRNGTQLGQIGVFQFADNSVLQRSGPGLFVATDGTEPELHPEPMLAQNHLETSNIDIMRSTVRMVSNMRTFESLQKALMTYSKMGEKANEVGQL